MEQDTTGFTPKIFMISCSLTPDMAIKEETALKRMRLTFIWQHNSTKAPMKELSEKKEYQDTLSGGTWDLK